jgi:hypothetical protein
MHLGWGSRCLFKETISALLETTEEIHKKLSQCEDSNPGLHKY